MKTRITPVLFWVPRILCIVFALLLSTFALDVFGEGLSFWQTVLALLVHLIPTWIIIAVLIVSWHRGWFGAAFFPGLGLLYLVTTWGRFHWSVYLMIAGPLFLMGVLFLGEWLCGAKPRRAWPLV